MQPPQPPQPPQPLYLPANIFRVFGRRKDWWWVKVRDAGDEQYVALKTQFGWCSRAVQKPSRAGGDA